MRAAAAAPRQATEDGTEDTRDGGFSLVELLVAMGLFGVLASLLLGLALSTGKVTDDVRALSNINEESRLAVERLSRELRQATQVTAISLPATATDRTALTFWTDFDGNGTQDLNAADPEILTYAWDPQTDRLSLTVNDPTGVAITRPLLAANVSSLKLDLRSSDWEFDTDNNGQACELDATASGGKGKPDGKTCWQELDAIAAGGNGNGKPDGPELLKLDLIGVTMTVLDGPRAQTYTTRVDLRNRG